MAEAALQSFSAFPCTRFGDPITCLQPGGAVLCRAQNGAVRSSPQVSKGPIPTQRSNPPSLTWQALSTTPAAGTQPLRPSFIEAQSGGPSPPPNPASPSSSSSAPPNGSLLPGVTRPALASSFAAPPKPTFDEIMAFDGAPEIVNGRLAMLGFVWGCYIEAHDGVSFVDQLFNPNQFGLFFAALSTLLVTAASIAPLLRSRPSSPPSFLFFTEAAEVYNGRVAMLGIVGVFLFEYLTSLLFG